MFDYKHSYTQEANLSADSRLVKLLGVLTTMENEIDEARNQEVILVIGATGAGKSTFINYVAAREMYLDDTQADDAVICKNPLASIGHGMKSHTDRPQLYKEPTSSMVFSDCPGFFDNRGVEVEVANAIGIQGLAKNSKLVKGIVLLVDRASFLSGRGQMLEMTIKSTLDFLGPELDKNLDSIMMLISKVPSNKVPAFIKIIHDESEKLPLCAKLLQKGNLGFYSPLDDLKPGPSVFTRDSLLKQIKHFKGIANSTHTFNISISPSANLEVTGLINLVSTRIRTALKKEDFEPIPNHFKLIDTLSRLNIDRVVTEIDKMFSMVVDQIKLFGTLPNGLKLLKDLGPKMPECYQPVIKQTLTEVTVRLEKEQKIAAEAQKTQQELQNSKKAIGSLESKQSELKDSLKKAEITQQEYEKQNRSLQVKIDKTSAEYAKSEQRMQSLQSELSETRNIAARTRDEMEARLSQSEQKAEDRIKSLQSELERERESSSNNVGETIILVHPYAMGPYGRPMGGFGCHPRFMQ